MPRGLIMRMRIFLLALSIVFSLVKIPCHAQNLEDLARKEREKREQQKSAKKVYTNDDLGKYENQREASSTPLAPESAGDLNSPKSLLNETSGEEERQWSKRFIEAKSKIEEAKKQGEDLQTKLTDLNLKLMRQSDVFDREHLYGPLINQTKQQIEQNKADKLAAEQALEDLHEELRKSGKPASWENSEAALKPLTSENKGKATETKDQKYWLEQLGKIDKRFDALVAPLQEEEFQLVHRRSPKEGETPPNQFGLGRDPRAIDIDVQIKELKQKRDQEKKALIEKAIQQGALPGWFR